MQSDPYTRAMLTFIALALLVLVARGFGLGEEPEPDPAETRGVWSLQMLRVGLGGPPTLMKLNTATGEVWQTKLGANQGWTIVGVAEEDAAPAEPAADAAPVQPSPPAGAPPAAPPEAPPQP